MGLDQAETELRQHPRLHGGFVEWRTLPAEPARHADWPPEIDARIIAGLSRRGIDRPYTHQARAIEAALDGRDLVVVTPTASGKTLCYSAPVLQTILRDPAARALYLFPTKALAQDQLNELHSLIGEAGVDVKTFTYDGDTPPAARRAVRTAGHVVITNPDMLHTGILPNHTKWVRLFENLRYIVLDELHTIAASSARMSRTCCGGGCASAASTARTPSSSAARRPSPTPRSWRPRSLRGQSS